jgi:hypothetical protein
VSDRPEYTLLGSDDPMLWAEEFVRIFAGHVITSDEFSPSPVGGPVDRSTMVGWFAGAMATAVNMYERKKLAEKDDARSDVKVYDADNEAVELDDEQLTLEETFKEGFDEGRRV